MSPPVSAVLPTFNRAPQLGAAIASVLAQTHPVAELIVVDDGSTDDTAAVVAAVRDPRVRYEKLRSNGGVSAARNRGVELAQSPWVAFQDSDDRWLPDRLARQVAVARDGTVLVTALDRVTNDPLSSYEGPASGDPVLDLTEQAKYRLPPCATWLARRETLLAAGGFDPALDCYEDWELALRLLAHGRVQLVNAVLVERTRSPGSLFSDEPSRRRNLAVILQRHGSLLRGHPRAWAYYCNAIGQGEAQFGSMPAARAWFRRALQAAPASPRAWANLAMSLLGPAGFRGYVRAGRAAGAWWR